MKNEDRSSRTQTKILSAAAACFAEKGFSKCSMQDIADGAGMSKGAVYGHFESKEEVFRIMIAREHELGAQKSLEASKSPPYLDAIIDLLIYCISVPAFPMDHRLWITALAVSSRDEVMRKAFNASERSTRAVFRSLLEKGVTNGEIDPDIDLEGMAILIFALCDGLIARIASDPEFNFDEHTDAFAKSVRRALEKRS